MEQFFENTLDLLRDSNGNLSAAFSDFYANCSPDQRKMFVEFVLGRLLALAKSEANCQTDEFAEESHFLLQLLENTMKGERRAESLLFDYCEAIKRVPGARKSETQLAEWTKDLIFAVGLVISAGRSREYSASPPY